MLLKKTLPVRNEGGCVGATLPAAFFFFDLSETTLITDRLVIDADSRQARMVVDFLVNRELPSEIRIALLEALANIGRKGKVSLGQRVAPLRRLIQNENAEVASLAIANLRYCRGSWPSRTAHTSPIATLPVLLACRPALC